MWLLDKMLKPLVREGRLHVIDHDGKTFDYGDPSADPITVRFTDKGAALHVAKDPRMGAGEAYMDGRMVVEPPHDIRDLILFVMGQANRNKGGLQPPSTLKRWLDRIGSRLDQMNDRASSSKNAVHHYGLTRQFYELFLDEDRQYSMGYYRDPANSLERAQIDKKALVAAKLRLGPGMKVLDIGCGWGGLVCHAAQHYGVQAHGVTLSQAQFDFATEKVKRLGL